MQSTTNPAYPPQPAAVRYAELHAHSHYSFARGVSSPQTMVQTAVENKLTGLALLEPDGFHSAIQFAQAVKETPLEAVYGTEITLENGCALPLYAKNPAGYAAISRLLSRHNLAKKTRQTPGHRLAQVAGEAGGKVHVLTGDSRGPLAKILRENPERAHGWLQECAELFGPENVSVEIYTHATPEDRQRAALYTRLAKRAGVQPVITGGATCATPNQHLLAQVRAATAAGLTLEQAQAYLTAWPTHLKTPAEMLTLYPEHGHLLEEAARLAQSLSFNLNLTHPRLPPAPVPPGHTENTWLRRLASEKAHVVYGERRFNPGAWKQVEKELAVIEKLGFAGYFLIVYEIVEFCRRRDILCQGRGSAANSAVCYLLGITGVDAVKHRLLFERFLSEGRSGPPDIDLDIEAGRREEVIQHVYARYGRENAAQVANVITYRAKLAHRDAARALGFNPDTGIESAAASRGRGDKSPDSVGREASRQLVRNVASALEGLPRHMGIHPCGMVIADRPVIEVCPVNWASLEGRSVVQWDKDDCAGAGFVKFDLLGLGMLSALRWCFDELTQVGVRGHGGRPLGLGTIPPEDPRVYELLCQAQSVGVFQVESRAQRSMLPRLQPRCFYDLVVQVALIRPGPILGQSVKPYMRRKTGTEAITYPHPLLRPALEKTLGVPLFQEQLMQIAMEAASFTPRQADELRKAMAAKRNRERMEKMRQLLMNGMISNGISPGAGEEIIAKFQAFAEYGFPESHAFSFAHIVYASSWLKVHYPHWFYASLLANQPMGFYSPQSLIWDAKRLGVCVRGACINTSLVQAAVITGTDVGRDDDDRKDDGRDDDERGCTERAGAGRTRNTSERPAPLVDPWPGAYVLLGLAPIDGVGVKTAQAIVEERKRGGSFTDLRDLASRVNLSKRALESLASAGALGSITEGKRRAIWEAGALAGQYGHRIPNKTRRGGAEGGGFGWEESYQPPLPYTFPGVGAPELTPPTPGEECLQELAHTGTTTGIYPTQLVRETLKQQGILTIGQYEDTQPGTRVRVGGIVTHRQRPRTAAGTTFISLEDETGQANIICSVGLWKRYRAVALSSPALIVRGIVEKQGGATNLIADHLAPLPLAGRHRSRDFR